jgi:hypothetical protein
MYRRGVHVFHSRRMLTPTVALTIGAILATAVLASAASTSSQPLHADRAPYLQTFDGRPSSPHPWRHLTDWDVTVHSRDTATWHNLESMPAQHGHNCSAPPDRHDISSYDDAVFLCNDHLMTAISASGYGVIYLTPDRLVDFSAGEASIRFDLSTLRTSSRDWIDLWVSPYDEHLQLPLEDWLPDLNGPPRDAVHLRMDNFHGSIFRGFVIRNFVATQTAVTPGNAYLGYESVLTPSATTRTTFQLTISRTHLKFGIPALNYWWVDADIADLGWSSGVVQLGHHSYTPTKDCADGATCSPNTWHWDNVQINAAVPFTIIRADQRSVDWQAAPAVTFPQPAPAAARLRFAGVGDNIAVSFDGGATWEAAQLQAQTKHDSSKFQSYWTPIPAGTTSVQFRGQGGWWGNQWIVRDISIWGASTPSTDATQRVSSASNPAAPPEPADRPGIWTSASTD